ncbi:MAG: beta-ketoacyl synthase N-terminal-like domain-containing protein [Bacteroidota bacterium]
MMDRKVAVVGMGGVFPSCSSLSEFEEKLFTNQSLIREWEEAKNYGKKLRSSVCGYVTLEEAGLEACYSSSNQEYPEIYLDKRERIPIQNTATADIGSVWAMLSSLDAIEMSNWNAREVQSERTGVSIGSGGGGHTVLRQAWNSFFHLGKKSRAIGGHGVDRTMGYRDAANVSCLIKNKGVCEAIGSACATGLGNIGYAYRLIKFGIQDRMLAGGVEGTSLETFTGFDAMAVLSRSYSPEESSRPFDRTRNGFVCSFGGAVVALEELKSAEARGANIIAIIDGYFNNSDGDGDMFAPSFNGQQRLWNGLKSEVPHLNPEVVNVHGTSTPVGDGIELFSTIDALGETGYHIAAPKSQFGHMLGAAGAVEFIASLLMLKKQKTTPCLNANWLAETLEPVQESDNWQGTMKTVSEFRHLLPTSSLAKEINQLVSLNYGFGGTNSGIILSKYEGK